VFWVVAPGCRVRFLTAGGRWELAWTAQEKTWRRGADHGRVLSFPMVRLLELIIGKTARSFLGGLILGRRFLRGSIWNVNTICIYAMRYGWGERKHRGASASMGDLVRSSGGVTGQAAHSPIQPSICASQIGESVRGSRYQNEWSAWLPSPVPKSERPFGKLRAGSGAPSAWTGDLTGTGATRRPAA
jgi:hypothetical protein